MLGAGALAGLEITAGVFEKITKSIGVSGWLSSEKGDGFIPHKSSKISQVW